MLAPDHSSGISPRLPAGPGVCLSITRQLSVSVGQYSDRGRKAVNQDFHAWMVPAEPLLGNKGIAITIADGISSSEVSQEASETSIKGFMEDYYATPESWLVKTSVQRVLQATNSWLYAQNRNGPFRYDLNRGYVSTFSGMVLKSSTAHIFHVGDSRVYRVGENCLEQLTEDHRMWVSREKSYLERALGMRDWLDLDYRTLDIETGDIYLLATDGVYEFVPESFILDCICAHGDDLDRAARLIADHALEQGSNDNLTIQIVRIDQLPQQNIEELQRQTTSLPLPPELRPRMEFDGFEILQELHSSSRSHVYLAQDMDTRDKIVLKVPSVDLSADQEYLERFLMEDWVARRIDNAHVLKPFKSARRRNFLYIATEFVDGLPLSQWIIDNPDPDLESVRNIVEQIARGLRALHRLEMLHQDLRPNNIMIDSNGTVKLIDFGSVRVAGVAEMSDQFQQQQILGTMQYSAPEYFIGETASWRSDLFSLGVITYQMLSGRLPYGPQVARATTRAAQRKLSYQSVLDDERTIPVWIDGAIRKAVHPDPLRRYDSISEFIFDLRHPNHSFVNQHRAPLLERNPILFWKGLSLILVVFALMLALTHPSINPEFALPSSPGAQVTAVSETDLTNPVESNHE